jgi:hypothetical protein
MSRGQRLTFLGIAAAIAVVAVILLSGGSGDTGDGSNAASTATPSATAATGGAAAEEGTPTPTPTPKPKPKPVLLKAGSEKALNYEQGETVRFRAVSDEPEEIHVHGYDITRELEPGKVETVAFKATIPGIFEIELHGTGEVLAQLKVVP